MILFLLACGLEVDESGTPIEITGYLEADQIGWTTVGGEVVVYGLPGSTAAERPITIDNERTGEGVEIVPSALGDFAAVLRADPGDVLTLTQPWDSMDVVIDEVPMLPQAEGVAFGPDAERNVLVVVKVDYDDDLVLVAPAEGRAARFTRLTERAFAGHVPGEDDDGLLVAGEGMGATNALELVVR